MTDNINFEINGQNVFAEPGETIWQVADRLGIELPHLCYLPGNNYRAVCHCRACLCES